MRETPQVKAWRLSYLATIRREIHDLRIQSAITQSSWNLKMLGRCLVGLKEIEARLEKPER